MQNMVVVPSRFREARERAGISQRDAAARLNVTERALRAWEKGDARIPADHAASLARFYGVVDLWSLFTHEPEADTPSDGHGKGHEPGTAVVGDSAELAHEGA